MLITNVDSFIHISRFLTDREKIYLATTSSSMNILKYKFRYCERIRMDKIVHLPYFHNFEFVKIHSIPPIYPKCVKFIHLLANSTDIPSNITHLTFRRRFNKPVKYIPLSVTYLKFGDYFNHPIDGLISSSVTQLKLRWEFNHPFTNNIPSSVTHLTLYCSADKLKIGDIPSSVVYLKVGGRFKKNMKDYAPFVTHLSFGWYCLEYDLRNTISGTITHLYFFEDFDGLLDDLPHTVKEISLNESYNLPIDQSIIDRVRIRRYFVHKRNYMKNGIKKYDYKKVYFDN